MVISTFTIPISQI